MWENPRSDAMERIDLPCPVPSWIAALSASVSLERGEVLGSLPADSMASATIRRALSSTSGEGSAWARGDRSSPDSDAASMKPMDIHSSFTSMRTEPTSRSIARRTGRRSRPWSCA